MAKTFISFLITLSVALPAHAATMGSLLGALDHFVPLIDEPAVTDTYSHLKEEWAKTTDGEKRAQLQRGAADLLTYVQETAHRNTESRLASCQGPAGQSALPLTPVSLDLTQGTSTLMPDAPLHSDGTVDLLINIRGVGSHDVKFAGRGGIAAVVITGEAGGMASAQNTARYGNQKFLRQATHEVLHYVRRLYPRRKDIRLGNLCFSAWSGGYGPIQKLLYEQHVHPEQWSEDEIINCVILADGMHHTIRRRGEADHPQAKYPFAEAYADFARKAMGGERVRGVPYRFSVLHTSVPVKQYPSTTETAEDLLRRVELEKSKDWHPEDHWRCQGKIPSARAERGNFNVIELFPTYYLPNGSIDYSKHPYQINGRANVPGTIGHQHIQAQRLIPCLWGMNLCQWNETY